MSKNKIIAIDGPAGSGKSTIAKALAQKYDLLYVDTGAMYRAVTHRALQKNCVENKSELIGLLSGLNIRLKFENGVTRVFIDAEEVTEQIRTPEVNNQVSEVSRVAEVRAKLVELQRSYSQSENLIVEGRDITTVVFPDADLKIYLTASLDERAERRYVELQERHVPISLDETKENIAKRDSIDSGRKISPLKIADDAIQVDTTDLSIDEVVAKISELIIEIL